MSSNRNRSNLLSTLAGLCLLLAASSAWAQAPAPAQACGAKPVCSAEIGAAQKATSASPDLSLEGLFTPSPIFKSIPGDCCPATGYRDCPPIPGRRVVGCGSSCDDGSGRPACLYL